MLWCWEPTGAIRTLRILALLAQTLSRFTASDGPLTSNTATITVTITHVNRAPVAQAGVLDVTEDVSATGTLIATDADGNGLTYSVVAQPTKGVITMGTNGSYTFAPNSNANGADTFTFKVNDGTVDSNTATISVTIAPVNDAPVAQNGTATTNENLTFSGQLAATDPDGNTLTYSLVTSPTRGGGSAANQWKFSSTGPIHM